jgi:hypothetical protein
MAAMAEKRSQGTFIDFGRQPQARRLTAVLEIVADATCIPKEAVNVA